MSEVKRYKLSESVGYENEFGDCGLRVPAGQVMVRADDYAAAYAAGQQAQREVDLALYEKAKTECMLSYIDDGGAAIYHALIEASATRLARVGLTLIVTGAVLVGACSVLVWA